MIVEVPVTHPDLLALFDPEISNHPMLFSTLFGRTPGRAFVDDAIHPVQCLVRSHDALVFFSRGVNLGFWDEGMAYVKQFGHVALIWRYATAALEIPKADRTIQRLAFPAYEASNVTLAVLKNNLPDGFTLRMIDKDLLERCAWCEEIESFCGSPENFLAHGFGICMMRGDEIISEAYSAFVGINKIEIGAVTTEAYRGHGYGAITCADLILACRERGFEPYWSCDADNAGSIALARKLGFQHEHAYAIELYRGMVQ